MSTTPLKAVATGVAMGAADLVPGVSGGTIAFVAGIYDELINSLASFDRTAVGLLVRGRFGAFARHVNLRFLAPLLLGIFTVVFTLSGLLDRWLDDPTARTRLFAFFAGLVVASIVIVAREVDWTRSAALLAGAGAGIGFVVVMATPARTPETAVWALLGGGLAICAMILPGISGSFILLLVGQYERAVEAVAQRDLATIVLFGLGAALGLLFAVRVLRWALARYRNPTLAVLVGFIVGSLPRLWPWDSCLDCARPDWYLPDAGQAIAAIAIAVGGAAAVVAFERWASAPDR